jgi:hypothetical protein
MNSVFEKNPCRGLYKIPGFFRSLKWAYQRATRGYADCDVWNIDMWFLSVMPDMLKQLESCGNSYPYDMTPTGWRATLREMARCFEEAGKEPDFGVGATLKEWEQFDKAREKNLDEGFEMFRENFWDLWD